MEPFPVINSTLSASHLGLFLQDKYQLSSNTTCGLLKTGINDSYLVIDGTDKYVFRVYSLNWRTEKEIQEEIRLLNLLRENGIPVSYPLADANNNYIQQLNAPEGSRFGVLFSFAKGEKLLNFPAELHYKAGEIMARMHQLIVGMKLDRVTYTPQVVLKDSFGQLKKFISVDTEEMVFMASAQQYLLGEIEKADIVLIRHGAVHLDIWFDNLSIDKKKDITIFDFDFCGNGWLCYDIAYYILQLHSTEKDENECKLKTDAFLKGYQSITPISDEEKRLLPILGVSLYFFYLGIQCQRFDNWSNAFLNEGYLKRFINLLVRKYFEKNGLG
ncbi:MAG TPA: phosphotransferase [Mucilaginibacter sp.]|nr:phosphotransferase [Mucilaginibacter sp.]